MTIIGNPFFIQFVVPLITVALSVFLKFVTRNDQHVSFQKEDLAFGIDLSITALLLFVVSSSTVVQQSLAQGATQAVMNKANTIPWILLSVFIGIWAISTIVRKVGWEGDGKLHVVWGISVPNIFGILVLLFVVNWIKP